MLILCTFYTSSRILYLDNQAELLLSCGFEDSSKVTFLNENTLFALIRTVSARQFLMRAPNICFYGEVFEIIPVIPSYLELSLERGS